MKHVIDSKALAVIMNGSDELRLAGYDKVLGESKIKRIASFDKYVIGLDEGTADRTAIVRVTFGSDGKVAKVEPMPIELQEEVQVPVSKQLVEWVFGGEAPDQEEFSEFLNNLATTEAKMNITSKKIDSFLQKLPAPKEEWIKAYGDDAKVLAEQSLQSIGAAVSHLEQINQWAQKVIDTPSLCTLWEAAAPYAKPLGTVVSSMKDFLTGGAKVSSQKFMEQLSPVWNNIVIAGKFFKNATEV